MAVHLQNDSLWLTGNVALPPSSSTNPDGARSVVAAFRRAVSLAIFWLGVAQAQIEHG